MPRPLIAVTDSPFPSLDPAKAALAPIDPELRLAKSASAEDILAVARDADAILVTYAKLPGDLLRQLSRCKVIGRFGLGVDNIDLPAAKERGITVTYVPDYCLQEVSDHAMALLLALARKIPLSNKLVQSGRWEMPAVEPLAKDCRLVGRDNVILTPHTAFYSVEALNELQTKCASDVARVLSGEKPVYPISA